VGVPGPDEAGPLTQSRFPFRPDGSGWPHLLLRRAGAALG